MADDIGDRFKDYERCFDFALPRRMPMVIRVDGRAFHNLKLVKPFDSAFFHRMAWVALPSPGTIWRFTVTRTAPRDWLMLVLLFITGWAAGFIAAMRLFT